MLKTEKEIRDNPATSFWLRAAIDATAKRDPVDAARDVRALLAICEARLTKTLEG